MPSWLCAAKKPGVTAFGTTLTRLASLGKKCTKRSAEKFETVWIMSARDSNLRKRSFHFQRCRQYAWFLWWADFSNEAASWAVTTSLDFTTGTYDSPAQ